MGKAKKRESREKPGSSIANHGEERILPSQKMHSLHFVGCGKIEKNRLEGSRVRPKVEQTKRGTLSGGERTGDVAETQFQDQVPLT